MRSDGWSTDGPVLLVDGGGTKTRAVLVGDDDQPLGEGRAGPSNLMLGTRNARAEVEVACGKAISVLGPTETLPTELPLCCAMAGAGNRHLCEAFSADGKRPAILVSDAYAAMVGALGGEPGVGIVVGTGSAAFCLAEDGSVRDAGGWGPAIGDEGSGAWIGRAAVSLAAKIIDGQSDILLNGSSRSDLLAFVERRVSATGRTRTTLLEWVREASPADFAKLSPAILDDATSGNTVAIALLNKAVSDLEDLRACLDPSGKLPVALIGGLAEPMARFLSGALMKNLIRNRGDAIDGLLAMARGRVPAEDMSERPI